MYKNIKFTSLKKRILIFLTLVFMLAQTAVPVAAADSSGDVNYLNNITLLEKLGIITAEDQMQYSEESVSREDFAAIVGAIDGFTRDFSGSTAFDSSFADVAFVAENYGSIAYAVDIGAMDIDANGNFRPTQDVTVEQVVKAMVTLLGYGRVNYNNDDSFYIKTGQTLKLLSGIKTAYSRPITKGELVTILIRTLDKETLKIEFLGAGASYSENKDTSLLNDKFNVYKLTGVLQATSITGIGTKGAARNGHITLGGYDIETEEDLTEYLGMYFTAYCTGTKDLTELKLLYGFMTNGKNNKITIQTEDVTDIKNDTMYYELGGKDRQIKIQSKATIIYNGTNYPLYDFSTTFMTVEKNKDGSVTFLDADNDGKYETIFIKSYQIGFVDHVYKNGDNISLVDKTGNMLFGQTFDISDESSSFTFIKNGINCTYEDIGKKSIVSFAADKYNTCYEFLISNKTVEGTILNIADDELKIDDNYYKMCAGFNMSSYGITVGDVALFYFDAFGKVAQAEKKASAKEAYGMLESVKVNRKEGCIGRITIFTTDGVHKDFECAEKVFIDGTKYKYVKTDQILAALKAGKTRFFAQTGMASTNADDVLQLVKYSVNSDGKISSIITISSSTVNSENELNLTHNINGTYVDTDSKIYNKTAASRWFGKPNAYTFFNQQTGNSFVYDGNLVIFALPNDKGLTEAFAAIKEGDGQSAMNRLSYEGYGATQKNDAPAAFCFFDVDDDTKFFPILLVEKQISTTTVAPREINNMMVLEKLIVEYNEEDEATYHVMEGTAVSSGAKVRACMPEDVYKTEYLPKGIVSGDVVRWNNDALGIVNCVELFIDNIGPNSKITQGSSAPVNSYPGNFYESTRFTCGNVEYFNDKYILLKNGTDLYATIINPSAKVLVYDSQTKKTTKGDYSMIKTTRQDSVDPSLVVTIQSYSAIQSIVIFK